MSDIARRALIKGAGLSALAFSVGGTQVLLSPRAARAENIPFRGLFPTEGASNPTYTIFAVSQRGAKNLVSKWGSVAG
jgi:hypothetical protein